jgi:homoserine kinase
MSSIHPDRNLADGLRLRLPATSANLGPGFDALGLALALYLNIEAHAASEFTIDATGRNLAQVEEVSSNLILQTYRDCAPSAAPLHLKIKNEVPLGMGLGSSATALVAGVALANHFGDLGWTGQQVMEEACRREVHPDNVAACWFGGMTASAMTSAGVVTVTSGRDLDWPIVIAMPGTSLATEKARALLPDSYSRADTVFNVQRVALLTAAFAQDRRDLLRIAMEDRMHQPYREQACPLLARLLPLAAHGSPAQRPEVAGVALSGAGPSVLLIGSEGTTGDTLCRIVEAELLVTGIAGGAEIQTMS